VNYLPTLPNPLLELYGRWSGTAAAASREDSQLTREEQNQDGGLHTGATPLLFREVHIEVIIKQQHYTNSILHDPLQ
jgi:hypothetical protein